MYLRVRILNDAMIGDRNICTWIDTDILRCVATRVVQREECSIFLWNYLSLLFEIFWILDLAAQYNEKVMEL